MTENLDIFDEHGNLTGESRDRKEVHNLGLFHKAVHVWLFCPDTQELLLQKRANNKDSWPSKWDISAAGHIISGGNSLQTAQSETEEELGLFFEIERFKYLFTHLEQLSSIQHGKPFINNEFNDVFVIIVSKEERESLPNTRLQGGAAMTSNSIPTRFVLQASEVEEVKWLPWTDVRSMYISKSSEIVPCDNWNSYKRLFEFIEAFVDT